MKNSNVLDYRRKTRITRAIAGYKEKQKKEGKKANEATENLIQEWITYCRKHHYETTIDPSDKNSAVYKAIARNRCPHHAHWNSIEEFFYGSSAFHRRLISGNERLSIPYADFEMRGIQTGKYCLVRYSTREMGFARKSLLTISNEPHMDGAGKYWNYTEEQEEGKCFGVVIRNYRQFMFVGEERQDTTIGGRRPDHGTQIMTFINDNNPNYLNGLLLSITKSERHPCTTRIYAKYDTEMDFEKTGLHKLTKTEKEKFLSYSIDDDYKMLLAYH